MRDIAKKLNSISITPFSGVDLRDTNTDPTGTSELVNFRMDDSGVLSVRGGSRLLADIGEPIQAIWSGSLDDRYRCFVLANGGIYELDLDSGEYVQLGNSPDKSKGGSFFYYRRRLYFINGTCIYTVDDEGATPAFGYVPHIIKDWHDSEIGEINEPRNLLNNRGRLTYIVSPEPTSVLHLNDYISSIDEFTINGEPQDISRCFIGSYSPYISISGLRAGDRISLCVTYKSNPHGLSELYASTRAAVFGGINTSRIFLFGGNDYSIMYSSRYVSESSLRASKAIYPQSDALYFPAGYNFCVGDGRCPISAVSRHYDRLLIFTEGDAWVASNAECDFEAFPVMNINSAVGVMSPNGAAVLGNNPYTAGARCIYRWTSDTDKLDNCNAYSISDGIKKLLTPEFLKGAVLFSDTEHGELWISSPAVSDNIFVYFEKRGAWGVFSGLRAEHFFEAPYTVGYTFGSCIYLFDENEVTDNGAPINALWRGNAIDFGTGNKKQLKSFDICYEGEGLSVGISFDGMQCISDELSGVGFTRKRRRTTARRFNSLCPFVTGVGGEGKLYSLKLSII